MKSIMAGDENGSLVVERAHKIGIGGFQMKETVHVKVKQHGGHGLCGYWR